MRIIQNLPANMKSSRIKFLPIMRSNPTACPRLKNYPKQNQSKKVSIPMCLRENIHSNSLNTPSFKASPKQAVDTESKMNMLKRRNIKMKNRNNIITFQNNSISKTNCDKQELLMKDRGLTKLSIKVLPQHKDKSQSKISKNNKRKDHFLVKSNNSLLSMLINCWKNMG